MLHMTHQDAITQARGLMPLIEAHRIQAKELRRQSDGVIEAIKFSGLLRLLIPPEMGGFGLDVETMVDCIIEVAKADASTGWCFACFLSHNALLGYFPEQTQREVWCNGPDTLIATSFVANAARPVDGGYILETGRWPWASGIDACSWCIVLALVSVPGNAPDPMLFLLPRPDYAIEDDWETIAMEATGSKTLLLEREVFVPSHHSLSMHAIRDNHETKAPFSAFLPALVAPILGSSQRAYEIWLKQLQHSQTKTREQVASLSHVQIKLGEIAGYLRKAQVLLRQALALSSLPDPIQRIHLQRDYADIVNLCVTAVEAMFRQSGANVIRVHHPLQQHWRDVSAMSLHIGFNTFTAFENFGRSELVVKPDCF